jgi:outer membrane protein OmpA-like peptidoglycan-associated protein
MHKLLGTEQTKRLIVDVLLVSREFSRANGPAVRQLIESYFRTLKHFRDNPAALADEVKQAARVDDAQLTAILAGVRWATLEENAREWFGIAAAGGDSAEGLIEALESTARILVDSGDMRESPIPERDPYRLQHRLYVEDLFRSILGAAAQAPGAARQGGGRKFAALTEAQWEGLREIGTLKVRPITFQSGSSELGVEGRTEVDAAAQNLKHYPNFRIVVRGHTGTRGDPESNRQLSLERADTIKRHFLVTHGIEETRVRAVGYGGERPLARLEGETDRAYEYRLPRVELQMAAESY